MSASNSQRRLSSSPPAPRHDRRHDRLAVLIPPDLFYAVRAGGESVLASWLVAVIPTVALYVAGSSHDAAAALSLGSALRTGTALWSLGLGGSLGEQGSDAGVIGLPMLGMTLVQLLITRWSVRRSRLTGPLSGVWSVLTAGLTAGFLCLVAAPSGSRTWPATVGSTVLMAVVVTWQLGQAGRLPLWLRTRWGNRPSWVSAARALAREVLVALGAGVVLVAAAAVVSGAGRASTLHDTVTGGALVASAGLILLQVAWVPTALVWCLSWIVGSGFAVGTGTLFAPERVVAGPVPSVPLLGLLPSDSLGSLGLYVPLLVTGASLVVVWHLRSTLAVLRLPAAMGAAAVAAGSLAVLVFLACLGASGPIGPGLMSDVGPNALHTSGLLLLELGAGLVAGAVLVHPTTRSLTGRGVRRTAEAAGTVAVSAREHLSGDSSKDLQQGRATSHTAAETHDGQSRPAPEAQGTRASQSQVPGTQRPAVPRPAATRPGARGTTEEATPRQDAGGGPFAGWRLSGLRQETNAPDTSETSEMKEE